MSGGELFTRGTIFIALCFSVLGAASNLLAHKPRWKQWMRWAWTFACLAYLAHVIAAFHYYHDWSHVAAYQATAQQTAAVFGLNWGGGLLINYAFTIAWVTDVAWWWWKPESYGRRPRTLVIGWRAFFLLMVFNATVVFGTRPVRWVGLVVCLALTTLWWLPSLRKEHY